MDADATHSLMEYIIHAIGAADGEVGGYFAHGLPIGGWLPLFQPRIAAVIFEHRHGVRLGPNPGGAQ